MKKHIIALDIGGTKIYSGIFFNDRPVKVLKHWTEGHKGRKRIERNIINAVEETIGKMDINDIGGIGIAAPGPLDYKSGKIINTPNLPLNNFDIKGLLEKKFKVKVKVENDANCAALAEAKARDVKDLILLTLGTGVGSGMILNGKIFRGEGFGVEFGHMVIDLNGVKCNCGRNGCLETCCNSRAVERIAKGMKIKDDVYEIMNKALKGKGKYKKVYGEIGKNLGVGLANIVNALDIRHIVIGGGISKAGNLIIKPAKKMMDKSLLVQGIKVKVEKAKLGEYASLIGAAELF